MQALLLFVTVLALVQAPPPTKAEQLQDAVRKGDAAAVKKLLDEGADVNTKYRYNVTPIFFACDAGHLEVARLLLERGADLTVKDTFYGMSPLALAVSPPRKKTPAHNEIAKLLIAKGSPDKAMALGAAIGEDDEGLAKAVLDSGGIPADVLSDALEQARADKKMKTAALFERSGAKPYDDFKIDPARLASYAGSYRLPNGNEVVITVAGTRLIGAPSSGPQSMLSPRDEKTFRLIGQPGATITFNLEADRVTGLTLAQAGRPNVTYVRVEGK